MSSMSRFSNSRAINARIASALAGPRLLRAIPSMVVLTTAMAWGGAQAGGPGLDGELRAKTGVNVAVGPVNVGGGAGAGVGLGAAGSGATAGSVGVGAGAGANTHVTVGGGTANQGLGLDTAAGAKAREDARAAARPVRRLKKGVQGELDTQAQTAGRAGADVSAGAKTNANVGTSAEVGAGVTGSGNGSVSR